jgi:hypothetical protein
MRAEQHAVRQKKQQEWLLTQPQRDAECQKKQELWESNNGPKQSSDVNGKPRNLNERNDISEFPTPLNTINLTLTNNMRCLQSHLSELICELI